MVFILFLLLGILVYISYKISNKNLISVSFLTNLIFMISTAVVMVNYSSWGDISLKTAVVILAGNIAVLLGEFISLNRRIVRTSVLDKKFTSKAEEDLNFKYIKHLIVLLFIFTLLILLNKAIQINYVAQYLDMGSGTVLGDYKLARLYDKMQFSFYDKITDTLSLYILYILSFNLIHSYFIRTRISKVSVILVFLNIINLVITGYRLPILLYLTYAFALFFLMFQLKSDFQFRLSLKIIIISTGVVLGFLFLFFIAGKFIMPTNLSIFEYLSLYIGSSIKGLDIFLRDFEYSVSNFGQNTFHGIHNIVRRIGIEFNLAPINYEFVRINDNVSSNVFSVYRRLLEDFGYLGMIGIRVLFGFAYTELFNIIRSKKKVVFAFSYAYIFHPIVMQSIDETFFKDIVNTRPIIVYILVILTMSVYKKYNVTNFETK